MVLPDPIVCLRISWSFCNLNGQAKFMYCFSFHFMGPLRLCCFIWLFLCEVIFLLNVCICVEGIGGVVVLSRRVACTLFGFIESFGN